jgi:peptide-methionine (S)-S-oxide reductase
MFAGSTFLRFFIVALILGFAGGAYFYLQPDPPREKAPMTTEPKTVPPKTVSETAELATLGGGCFWCLEAVFEQVQGVERVESGYMGGTVKNPTYRDVCSGTTKHAEVVQVAFDPKVISYREILQIFFVIHDPTTLNRQGADSGTQYRSAIFYHSPAQKETAEKLITEFTAEKIWDRPIVTEVTALDTFYRAEDYHQGYFQANPGQPYCQAVVAPKVAKLRKHFLAKLKTP